MVFEFSDGNRVLRISVREHSLTLSVDGAAPPLPGEYTVLTYDPAGRPVGAFVGGHHFKRGLDNRLVEVWREGGNQGRRGLFEGKAPGGGATGEETEDGGTREKVDRGAARGEAAGGAVGGRTRAVTTTAATCPPAGGVAVKGERRIQRDLDQCEKEELYRLAGVVTRTFLQVFPGTRWPGRDDEAARAITWLTQVCALRPSDLEADRGRFAAVYGRIGILPPDQYLSVVLKATEGCSHGRCTFCSFYRDLPFHIKTTEEFRAHISAVRSFLGESLALRRSVFLGDANALIVPQARLMRLLSLVGEGLGDRPVYAFLDAFGGGRKTAAEFAAMREHRLARVYIGMESGDPSLLRFLDKPGTPDQILATVSAIKAGGVSVGVIVMAGVGGDRYSEAHTKDTIDLVNAMPLGKGDIVYLSRFVAHPDLPYAVRAREAGIRPLSLEEVEGQMAAFRDGFRFRARAGPPPKVSVYDIERFIY